MHQLNNEYLRLENLIALHQLLPCRETEQLIRDKTSKLAVEILNFDHECDQLALLQRISLKVLLRDGDPKKLEAWVLKNKEGVITTNSEELFHDLSKAKKLLINAGPEVAYALSNLITIGLGLKGRKRADYVKLQIAAILKTGREEALAHWINTEKIPLKWAGVEASDLEGLAPYLHHVDCSDLILQNPENLIKSFYNAHYLSTNSNNLIELKELPRQLQHLNCAHCYNLTTIDLSNNPVLTMVDCDFCKKLTKLTLLNTPQLKELTCTQCPLSTLDLSESVQLQKLFCSYSPLLALNLSKNTQLKSLSCCDCPFSSLDLSQNVLLQEIYCNNCPNLTLLDLSHNLELKRFQCGKCPITTLDLTQNLKLQALMCNNCENLTSLGASLSDTLIRLNCEYCTNLEQLPQVPQTASVYSHGSLCGELLSFKVNPEELEKNPKQALLRLGKILLQNKPMPNIVYLNTPGIDAGGLRRQFVATLCENLFKKDSGFTFVKEGDYTIPTSNDVDALRTFGRLLGLAAASHIPTGTNLHPSFFHSLFVLSDEELRDIPNDQSIPEPPKKKLHMARQGLPLESFSEEESKDMARDLKILTATAIIAKELQRLLGPKFRQFGNNFNGFITAVQGFHVTKETLKQSILCDNSLYKQWIDSFIDKLKVDELKRFLMLLTGSYTLSGDAITFAVYPSRKHLESSTIIHTCSKTMELPGDFTEVLLHKELTAQLSLIKSFNTA